MKRISSDSIDEVNNRTDMVALVGEYTRLERRGDDWWGCCPFHNEKTPSFHVVPAKKMCWCFACSKGGGPINFLMEMEKLDFAEAVQNLAKRAGVELIWDGGGTEAPPVNNTRDQLIELYDRVAGSFHWLLTESPQGKKAFEYLQTRGVDSAVIERFHLGFAPADRRWLHSFLRKKGYSSDFLSSSGLFSKKFPETAFFSNRLMFPIHNRQGKTVAFGGRILEGEGPKYLNSGDLPQFKKGETLFAFDLALPEIRKLKSVIFCEGYMDVIAWHQAGITRAVAPLGTAFTMEQARMVRSFAETVYLSFDSDQAGQTATYKAILLCRQLGFLVRVIDIRGGKDPADILLSQGSEALIKLLENSIIDMDYLILSAGQRFDVSNPEGKTRASAFLFPYLDVLESDIQRESTISRIAAALGSTEKALWSDYSSGRHGTRQSTVPARTAASSDKRVIKRTAELRAVLAVAANTGFFSLMRSQLTSDDFEDPVARDLYIVLEECFRLQSTSNESILARCSDEELRNLVTETIMNGEFSGNVEKVISDGIQLVKRNGLEKRRAHLVSRINLLRGNHPDDVRTLQEMIAEKQSIDEALAKLKDMNE